MDKVYLEGLIAEGLSQVQMGVRADCSRSTIARRLKNYGLKPPIPGNPTYDPIEKSYLETLITEGLSIRDIAERCERSEGSVKHWLKKYGLKTNSDLLPHKCVCGETDPDKFYKPHKTRCKVCRRAYQAKRLKSYKIEAVQQRGGECEICGYEKNLAALEFHHPDPSKKDPDFTNVRVKVPERSKAELEKCKLLCANCHREVHYPDYGGSSLMGEQQVVTL